MGSEDSGSGSGGGIGILGLLGVAFVVLKLTDVIDWSWWYVTMPFWGALSLCVVILGFGLGIFGLVGLVSHLKGK